MKHTPFNILCVLMLGIVVLSTTSCMGPQISPELAAKIDAAEDELDRARLLEEPPHLPGTYEHFVTHHGYPTTMKIYKDEQLLARAGGSSPVYICLEQQRGRIYVGDRVAADWPVSTGVAGRPTPTGSYRVLEKKPDYASNLYGKIKDANGKTVNYNADMTKDTIPDGGRFDGSPMPYWQRLTWDGLGMHVGKVKAGKRLSHGCIRTPREMAKDLFDITTFRTKVHIVDQLESCYPARDALVNGVGYQDSVRRREEAEAKLAALRKQAEEEIAAKLAAEQKAAGKKVTKATPAKKEAPVVEQPTVVKSTPMPVSNIGRIQPVMPRSKKANSYIHMPLPR